MIIARLFRAEKKYFTYFINPTRCRFYSFWAPITTIYHPWSEKITFQILHNGGRYLDVISIFISSKNYLLPDLRHVPYGQMYFIYVHTYFRENAHVFIYTYIYMYRKYPVGPIWVHFQYFTSSIALIYASDSQTIKNLSAEIRSF